MADDNRVAQLLSRELTPLDLFQYIRRNPDLNAQYTPVENMRELAARNPFDDQRMGQIMGEAGAVVDPFGVSRIQRMLGYDVPNMVRINEAHGLARRGY